MKIFVSVDAEGMPWAPYKGMMMPGDPLYGELRRIMTRIVEAFVTAIRDNGGDMVVVADSHGAMVNLDPFEIGTRAHLVRGFPRPLAMIAGAEGADAAFLVGYHTSPGVGGVLAHTYAGRIVHRVSVAGEDDASEYLLNTLALAELGVPVALVAGDALLRGQVEKYTPNAVFLPLKEPMGSLADKTRPWPELEAEIKQATARALEAVEKGGVPAPEPPSDPTITVDFKRPWHADLATLFPCTERLDGTRVRLACTRYLENYKLFEGLVIAAYSLERK